MDSDRRRFAERRLSVVQTKEAHAQLMQSPTYRAVYQNAITLMEKGHDPVMIAMALASLVSAMLEGIHDSASKRSEKR